MTLEERIKFLKNFFVGTFPFPFPFYLSRLIPKSLRERLTVGERRSSFIFPWNPVAILRSGRVRGVSLKKWIVFSELKRRGLFFLDSRTTPQTVGLKVAQLVGLKAMERSLFIDHSSDEEEIKQKLDRLIQFSLSTGKAVGIGHPHPSTLKSLKEMIPKMNEKGIEIVPLSAVME